jgi:hypothetical protein
MRGPTLKRFVQERDHANPAPIGKVAASWIGEQTVTFGSLASARGSYMGE